MANERLTDPNMTLEEVIITMADGNPGAIACMMQMMNNSPMAMLDILYLDSMEIYGEKIYMLWNDCCNKDMEKLDATLKYFRSGKISKEKILENLSQVRATPFI